MFNARVSDDRTLAPRQHSAAPARVEALETRRLLSGGAGAEPPAPGGTDFGGPGDFDVAASARSNTISDERDDFLPAYGGPHDPGLDVVAHQTTLAGDRVIFFGRMAGPIAPTQGVGGLYIIGVDRGRGTPRFRNGTPVIGPNVTWDLIVRINPDGTGLVNNLVGSAVTPLDPDDVRIDGNNFVASVPLSLLTPAATRSPEQWTYNLWPRNGLVPGQNVNVSDLAPDDGNSPVQVLSRPGSAGYGQPSPPDTAGRPIAGAAGVADELLGTGSDPVLA